MRRRGALEIPVLAPCRGLITRVPSEQPERESGRAATVASNVRFDDGVARTAPGCQELLICPVGELDSPVNFIFQANWSSDFVSLVRDVPIVATSSGIYSVDRRSSNEAQVLPEVELPTTDIYGSYGFGAEDVTIGFDGV